jgi:hypothetical protein
MPFAVELHIDECTASAVRGVWQALVQAGIPSQRLALGARPHISLCVYDSIDSSVVSKQLENFARQIGTIPFQFDTVETFDG